MFTQIKSGLEIFTVRIKMRAILAHSSSHSSIHKIRNTKESVTAQMRYSSTEVPEPSTIALFLIALFAIAFTHKNRSLSV